MCVRVRVRVPLRVCMCVLVHVCAHVRTHVPLCGCFRVRACVRAGEGGVLFGLDFAMDTSGSIQPNLSTTTPTPHLHSLASPGFLV